MIKAEISIQLRTGKIGLAGYLNRIKVVDSKPEASVLVQMRTGKIGLGSYLKSIGAIDRAVCQSCEEAYETVSHVLGECLEWGDIRKQYLYRPVIWDIPTLLKDSTLAQRAVQFMMSTQLLEQFKRC